MSQDDKRDFDAKTYQLATMVRSTEHFAISLSREKGVPMETVMRSIDEKKAQLD